MADWDPDFYDTGPMHPSFYETMDPERMKAIFQDRTDVLHRPLRILISQETRDRRPLLQRMLGLPPCVYPPRPPRPDRLPGRRRPPIWLLVYISESPHADQPGFREVRYAFVGLKGVSHAFVELKEVSNAYVVLKEVSHVFIGLKELGKPRLREVERGKPRLLILLHGHACNRLRMGNDI